jgi:alkylation response protein AidB-like acyl-CoA dehydrogenase
VGEIEVLLRTSAGLLETAAARADRGDQPLDADASSIVKHTVTENAISAVQKAVALAGNPALSRSNPIERHLRNVLCARVHSPQGDNVAQAVGRAVLQRSTPRHAPTE